MESEDDMHDANDIESLDDFYSGETEDAPLDYYSDYDDDADDYFDEADRIESRRPEVPPPLSLSLFFFIQCENVVALDHFCYSVLYILVFSCEEYVEKLLANQSCLGYRRMSGFWNCDCGNWNVWVSCFCIFWAEVVFCDFVKQVDGCYPQFHG